MTYAFRNTLLQRLTGHGSAVPAPTLVFLTAAVIALLQIPATIIMNRISLPLGLVVNEIVFVVGIPLVLVHALRFDRGVLFPHARAPAGQWLPLAILVIGTVITIDYLTHASEIILPLPPTHQDALNRVMAVSDAAEFALKFVLLCVVPAVCEEIFFRGFCQGALEKHWGTITAIIATGALFALLHANPWHAHLYFLLGCFLSWTYAVSRTLWVPIMCHLFNNAWTFTNHTLETTPPIAGVPLSINAFILAVAVAFTLIGGRWFWKSAR